MKLRVQCPLELLMFGKIINILFIFFFLKALDAIDEVGDILQLKYSRKPREIDAKK